MHRFTTTVAAGFGVGFVATGTPATAQELTQDSTQAVQTTTQAGYQFSAPFVWNGNALDQTILDAQAEMGPLHRPIRQQLRHHRRG